MQDGGKNGEAWYNLKYHMRSSYLQQRYAETENKTGRSERKKENRNRDRGSPVCCHKEEGLLHCFD